MPPLLIENLSSHLDILPPLIRKKRGHLRVKRIRKGALKRKQTKCTNCLQLGHNKRRCVAQPARNGRAERFRDWNRDSSSSDSNVDESTKSSDSELERELAPFVEQARAKAKAKALLAARVTARVAARIAAGDELSDLNDEVRARPPPVQASPASALSLRGSPAPALQVGGSPVPASQEGGSPAPALLVQASPAPVSLVQEPAPALPVSPLQLRPKASPALEPRPKRARRMPKKYH
jgi:hypothetical protein